MSLSVQDWKQQAHQKLQQAGGWLKARAAKDTPNVVYGYLGAMSLMPLVQAAASGNYSLLDIGIALGGVAGSVGTNLLANQIQAWKDNVQQPDEDEMAAWLADHAEKDQELREALDNLLEQMQAIQQVQTGLSDNDKQWFANTLQAELKTLGNLPRFEAVLKIEQGDQGQVLMGNEIKGSVVGPGGILTQVLPPPEPGPTPDDLREAYLNYIFESSSRLSLAGIDPKAAGEAEAHLKLGAVYTALLTQRSDRQVNLYPKETFPQRIEQEMDQVMRQQAALEQLNRQPKLVLLGDPGSGKSTFVNFVAACLAGEILGRPRTNLARLTAPLPDDEGKDQEERQPWEHGRLLPVRVILRDFAARGLPPAGETATAKHLWDFIETELTAAGLADYTPSLRQELIREGVLLLLDGLDEVPEANQRRVQLKQAVEGFTGSYPKCRVLVTSRTYAYQKQEWHLPSFAEAVLAAFSPGQIRRFVDGWYSHIADLRGLNEDDAQGRAELLKRAIFGSSRLEGLAERPLLLTLMASLHAWRGGSLPEKREELYADTVDLLLDWWESPKTVRNRAGELMVLQPSLAEWLKTDRDEVRALLNQLAYQAHASQPELTGTADVSEGELVTGLMRLSQNPDVNPVRLVEYLSQRAGLLLQRGVGVYTFPHRTFQEYLAACYLTDHDYPDAVSELARQDPNRWREVALLAGAKAARGSASSIWLLAEALCFREADAANNTIEDLWGALLAGQALVETASLAQVSERNQPKVERLQRWLVHVISGSDIPAVDRAAAGNTLAKLNDPRPAVTTLDQMEFCFIPAGPFWLGSEENDREMPLHKFNILYDYWLGRYPVTVAQFKAYVSASGYEPRDENSLKGVASHPVVDVTWYDALEFCKWLTRQWQAQGKIGRDWQVTLPSEAEWEKAARGGLQIPEQPVVALLGTNPAYELVDNPQPQRRYPWGKDSNPERANYDYTGIGTTSAVGCFGEGTSPYGCLDMAGNVFEWTRSLWGDSSSYPDFKYPYMLSDNREDLRASNHIRRVLRGGSWYDFEFRSRCSFRFKDDPFLWRSHYGFRIAVFAVKTLRFWNH